MASVEDKKYQKEIDKVSEEDKKYQKGIDKLRNELESLVKSKDLSASYMLRLAYASQFSNANLKTDQSANNKFLEKFENIKAKYPAITSPDFYQLAGVVAVKALDGPEIDFVPRRKESLISPDESCLPADKLSPSELRAVFSKVKISDSKHIVALYGGLKLATGEAQGANLKFDNSYFVDLVNKKEADLSPTDKALLDDSQFNDCVQRYAMKNEDFYKDYKEAYMKLFEFGLPYSEIIKLRIEKALVAPRAVGVGVGVVVAAAVVILSVFYVINMRRAKHSSQQFQ